MKKCTLLGEASLLSRDLQYCSRWLSDIIKKQTKKKHFYLCSEDEWRSYGFGTTRW